MQFRDPSYAGGANGPCLLTARANFAAFGCCEESARPRARPPAPEEGPRVDAHTAPNDTGTGLWALTWWLPKGSAANLPLVVACPGGVRGKPALLAALAKALRFPDCFGHNWDALDECLRDLSWLSVEHVHLDHPEWPALDTKEEATYLDILGSAVVATRYREGPLLSVSVPQAKAQPR